MVGGIYFWVRVTLCSPTVAASTRAGRANRESMPTFRIFRLEVFLHEEIQNELRNLDAIDGNRIHVNEALSMGPVERER